MAQLAQPSLSGGELSPSMYSRVDLERYQVSVRTGKNFIVRATGGMVNRPGLGYVAPVKIAPAVLGGAETFTLTTLAGVPVNATAYPAYAGGGFLRKAVGKALFLPDYPITAITLTNPCAITVTPVGGTLNFGSGNQVTFFNTGTPLDGQVLTVTATVGSAAVVAGAISPRLIPFQVSSDIAYIIELGDHYARFFANAAPLYSAPAVLTELVTPWSVADVWDVKFTQSADTMILVHPTHPPQKLVRLTSTTFSLTEFQTRDGPFADINVNDAVEVWANGEQGIVAIVANAPIFTPSMVGGYFYMEAKNLASVKPWSQGERAIVVGDLRRSDGKIYKAVTVPAFVAPQWAETGSTRPLHESGRAWDGAGATDHRGLAPNDYFVGVQWEYLHSNYGMLQFTTYGSSTTMVGTVIRRLPLSVVNGRGASINAWADAIWNGTTDISMLVTGAISDSPSDYQVFINGVVTSHNQGASTQGWSIDVATGVLTFFNPPPNPSNVTVFEYPVGSSGYTDVWAFGAWSPARGYPSEVEFFADRLIMANTPAQPQTLWLSQAGDYSNFGHSTPSVASDAIAATLNARQLNAIRDLVPLNELLMMTPGGEWKMATGSDDVLSPATVGFKPQSFFGASHVPALVIGDGAVFLQDRGFVARDLGYSLELNGYTGTDLTVFARHLIENKPIKAWAFQKVPYSVIWLVREDGVLLAMAYMREQKVVGWTPMEIDGFVESVACIPEGKEDALYVIVRRTVGGIQVRYIERLSPRRLTDVREGRFVDSCLTYDGRNMNTARTITATGVSFLVDALVTLTASAAAFAAPMVGDQVVLGYNAGGPHRLPITLPPLVRLTITAYADSTHVTARVDTVFAAAWQAVPITDYAIARNVMAGLAHLEGRTIAGLSDGFVLDQLVVNAGAVTLPEPGALVHLGLPYTADLQTLDINAPKDQIRMRTKAIKRLGLLVQETRSIHYGPDFDHLDEFETRHDEGPTDPPALIEGLVELWLSSTWNVNGRVCVRQSDPLPMSILGLLVDSEIGA